MNIPEECNDDIKYLLEEYLKIDKILDLDIVEYSERYLECIVVKKCETEIVNVNKLSDCALIDLRTMVEQMLIDNDIIHRINVNQHKLGLHKTIRLEIKV